MKGYSFEKAPAKKVLDTQPKGESIWTRDISFGSAISLKDRKQLYQLLGILMGAGLGILDCIEVLLDQFQKKTLGKVLAEIKEGLSSGSSLSQSLKAQKGYFSAFEIQSLHMAEQTGHMAEVLKHLSSYYEKQLALRRKLIQAFSYPIAVIIIAFLVLGFMIGFVVPMFEDIFKRFDAELPALTQSILAISTFIRTNSLWLFLGTTGLLALIFYLRKQARFRSGWSKLLLRLPYLGNLILKIHLARFAYTFALLLRARVSLERSLGLISEIVRLYPLKQVLPQIRREVIEGSSLFQAVKSHAIFPNFFTQIIKVGEKSAQLDLMMEKLAESLEEESEAGLGQVTQFLEPLLIIILGILVAIILAAMYLPMFALSGVIG